MQPDSEPLTQYCELYLDGQNILDLLLRSKLEKKTEVQFKTLEMLPLDSRHSVICVYVDSCQKFYLQLSEHIDEFNTVMDEVKAHCESSSSPGELPAGAACCALFPEDNGWYRAKVLQTQGGKVTVSYVDYGNELEVNVTDLRTITPSLARLPAQALKCALKGFETKPVEIKTSSQLVMLALGKTLGAHIVGVVSSDTMLVSLVNESESPPLDITRKMNELSTHPVQGVMNELSSHPVQGVMNELSTHPVQRTMNELSTHPVQGVMNELSMHPVQGVMNELSTNTVQKINNKLATPPVQWIPRQPLPSYDDDSDESPTAAQNKHQRKDNRNDSDKKFKHYDLWAHERLYPRPDRRGHTKDNLGERKDDKNREFNDNNRERGHRSDIPLQDMFDKSRVPPSKAPSKLTGLQSEELPNPVPLETPFQEPVVEVGAQHDVAVTWIITPGNFYVQTVSLNTKLIDMMHKIQLLYKGVESYTGMAPVGASVLARYPVDDLLYRATVIAVQPRSKYIVRYIDYGNEHIVGTKDIWQLDTALMDLPKMAVHCSLLGVAPKHGEWTRIHPDMVLCFNAPRYQCVFNEITEQQWKICLYDKGVSVADLLVKKGLATMPRHQSSVDFKDEEIDLTIIVEQKMLCKVTHVVSFDKFYVQLDLDKAALVEEAVAKFDATKLTPLTADSLSAGVRCTVRHDDKIYRAILNDVTDPQNIQAVLPDYGKPITTALANLMILPIELSVYYQQSVSCTFHNYTAGSNKLVTEHELWTRLQGNKFIMYIDDHKTDLVSTLYDIKTGKKVSIFEPDEGAHEEVIPLCNRAVFNHDFGLAYISHAENINEIYLQKSTDTDNIAVLLDELFKFYDEGTPEPLLAIKVDALCAAKSSDGYWYRATVISVDADDHIKVQYTDYGYSETVAKHLLKVLDPKFYEPCAFALVAGLGLVQLQDDATAKLLEWTTDKELQVTLAYGAQGWLASLHLDGVDLSTKLVTEKLATPQAATDEKVESASEPVSLPAGCTQCCITKINTPGHFWLQMANKFDAVEEIQEELQANADTYTNIESREMGTICVAKYLADDKWYRSEILYADAGITTVRFIDYGNTAILDNQPGLIKTLPEKYKYVERYAVKSSVNAMPSGTGKWNEQASVYFKKLVGDVNVPLYTLIVLKDVTTYVDLFVNGENVTDKLVSEGYATKSEAAGCGGLPSCIASHVNSPSEFWIQLETATSELQAMKDALVDAENFPELSVKEKGVICAAKYPEDGEWYRAQVIVVGSEGTVVRFMDYGNTSIANELRSLPDELKTKPALSRKCELQKPPDVKAWSRKSEVKFNELAAEGAAVFNVKFIASGDISIVELLLDNKSVTEDLVALCEKSKRGIWYLLVAAAEKSDTSNLWKNVTSN